MTLSGREGVGQGRRDPRGSRRWPALRVGESEHENPPGSPDESASHPNGIRLKLAAEVGEAAISGLVGEWSSPAQLRKWTAAELRRSLGLTERPSVPDLHLEPELASYDALLEGEVKHVD